MKAFAQTKLASDGVVKIEVIETPFLFDIKFRDPDHGMITGLGGVVLSRQDGGRTWTYLPTGSKQAIFSAIADDNYVVAVGEKGLRRISKDGGQNWQKLGEEGGLGRFPAEKHGYFRDVTCGTPTVCWMVGQGGNVLRSSDGGLSWFEMLPHPEQQPQPGAGE